MNVITLRDYAKQNNVSYEAVRKQVVRCADELGTHIIKDGRQQFLDEEAVAFLDAKRQKNPVAIIQMDKDEQIEALRREKENLLIKVAEQADIISRQAADLREADKALGRVDQLLLSAKEDKERAEALAAQNADLSADNAAKDKIVEDTKKEAQKALQELTEAHQRFEDELRRTKEAHERELVAEKQRRISLKEFWRRLKNKE